MNAKEKVVSVVVLTVTNIVWKTSVSATLISRICRRQTSGIVNRAKTTMNMNRPLMSSDPLIRHVAKHRALNVGLR